VDGTATVKFNGKTYKEIMEEYHGKCDQLIE
jgi:hypothetical protein